MLKFEYILALAITGAIAYALSKLYRKKLKRWQYILATIALVLAGYFAYCFFALCSFILTGGHVYQ